MERIKQVIIVRNDLKMRKGKLSAQVAHASLAAVLKNKKVQENHIMIPLTPELQAWVMGTFFKVVLKVESEIELKEIFIKAKLRNLPCAEIIDAGHTVFKEPTLTCIGIGPAKENIIDKITGDLKLL